MQHLFRCFKSWTGVHRTETIFIRFVSTHGKVKFPFHLCVLGSGGRGTTKSLLVEYNNTDIGLPQRAKDRFIINCGETSSTSWSVISNNYIRKDDYIHILTTHNTIDKTGGIGGLIGSMTIQNMNYHATVYSPPGLFSVLKERREIVRDISRGFLKFSHSVNITCPMFNVHNIVVKKNRESTKCSVTDAFSYVFEVPRSEYSPTVSEFADWTDAILVIDCPNEDYLTSVVDNPEFLKYQMGEAGEGYRTRLVVHMSSAKILSSQPYQMFMKKFGDDTRHILFHEECGTSVNSMTSSINFVLNRLNEDIFPRLINSEITEPDCDQRVLDAVNYLQCQYTGDDLVIRVNERVKQYSKYGNEVLNCVPDLDAKIKRISAASKTANVDPKEYPQLVFLGTGGSSQKWYRMQSCILVKVNADTSFVMDCGHGSYNQMVLMFGDQLEEELAKIKMIFISHLHLDHCMGLQTLLLKCRDARESLGVSSELYVLSHRLLPYLYLCSIPGVYSFKKCYKYVNYFKPMTFKPIKEALGLSQLHVADVIHSSFSIGLVVKHESGWSLAYTGDAYDLSRSFCNRAWNCDILIHEASYEDSLIRKRNINKHSCQCNAITNGKRLGAKFTLLTHICKHQNVGITPQRSKQFSDKNFIVHDFTKINLTQLPVLHMYTDLIYEIFQTEGIDKEDEVERFKKLKADKADMLFDY